MVALDDVSCPSFNEAADRTICSTTADPDSVPVLLDSQRPPVFELAADATPEPMVMLEPGGTYTYGVAVESGETSQEDSDHGIQHEFEDGVYALVVDGSFERDGSGGHVECVGIFRVEQAED